MYGKEKIKERIKGKRNGSCKRKGEEGMKDMTRPKKSEMRMKGRHVFLGKYFIGDVVGTN